ncbi:hypothetical protein [Parafrankia discariae]|uniref:hypothetical protein n=1 Tax=Parafrankia discariae TaxID=365528 RepID=UPI00039D6012|nr:hypothetical protein [Parafrankia discariae]
MASDTMTQLVIPGALVMVSTPDRGVPVASTADWHDALLNAKSGVTPAMKLVAFTVCTHSAPAGRPAPSGAYITSPGLSLLCEQTNFSRTHVQRQLSLLRANGWLVTIIRPAAGRPARYLLSVPVAVARAGGYRLAGEDVARRDPERAGQRDPEPAGVAAAPGRRTSGLTAVTSSDDMLTTPSAPGGPAEPGRSPGCLASGALERPALVRRRKRATYSAGGRGVVRVRRKPRTLPPSVVTDVIAAASSVAPVSVGETAPATGPERVDEAHPIAVGETSYVPFGAGGPVGPDGAAGPAGGQVRAVSDISTGVFGTARSPSVQAASSAAPSVAAPSVAAPSASGPSASAMPSSAAPVPVTSGRSLPPRPIVPVSELVASAARASEASAREAGGAPPTLEHQVEAATPSPARHTDESGPSAPAGPQMPPEVQELPEVREVPEVQPSPSTAPPPASAASPIAPEPPTTVPGPVPPVAPPVVPAPATPSSPASPRYEPALTGEAPSSESRAPAPEPEPEPETELELESTEPPVVDEIRLATRQVIDILSKMLRCPVEDFAELDKRVYEVLSEGDWAPVELATHLVNFVANGVWVNGDDVADNIRWRMDRLPLGVTECGCKSCLGWRAAPERPPRPAPPSAPRSSGLSGPSTAGASARTSAPTGAGPASAGPVAPVTTAATTKTGFARPGRSPAANPPAPPARSASASGVAAKQADSAGQKSSAGQANQAGPVEQPPATPLPPPPDLAAIAAAAAAGAEEARRNEEARRLLVVGGLLGSDLTGGIPEPGIPEPGEPPAGEPPAGESAPGDSPPGDPAPGGVAVEGGSPAQIPPGTAGVPDITGQRPDVTGQGSDVTGQEQESASHETEPPTGD